MPSCKHPILIQNFINWSAFCLHCGVIVDMRTHVKEPKR